MMNDREKMINALKDIADYFRTCRKHAASNGTAARKFEIYVEAAEDAAELLQVQEPREMTPEELQDWNDAVWFEEKGEYPFLALIRNYYKDDELSIIDAHCYGKITNHDMRLYNKRWRCWSSRPTNEQREAAPWTE